MSTRLAAGNLDQSRSNRSRDKQHGMDTRIVKNVHVVSSLCSLALVGVILTSLVFFFGEGDMYFLSIAKKRQRVAPQNVDGRH